MKASAFIDALSSDPEAGAVALGVDQPGEGLRILLVDHQDSFVHTLANYLRQTGAEVITLRTGFDERALDACNPGLVVLSPGPGTPEDFQLSRTIAMVLQRELPVPG